MTIVADEDAHRKAAVHSPDSQGEGVVHVSQQKMACLFVPVLKCACGMWEYPVDLKFQSQKVSGSLTLQGAHWR